LKATGAATFTAVSFAGDPNYYYDWEIPVDTVPGSNVYVYTFNLKRSPISEVTQIIKAGTTIDASALTGNLPALGMSGSLIPDTNAQYDLGSAEYKIRHLYLSDNTIYSDSGNIKVAQHQAGGAPSTSTRLISTAKLKEIAAASPDYGAFQAAIAALEDN